MSERAWLLAEARGHWLLAWTLVVLAVVLWIRIQRPRGPAIRYGGWLLATFAGAALFPLVVAVGPRVSWSDLLGLLRVAPSVPDQSENSIAFQSWFDNRPTSFRPESVTASEERLADTTETVTRVVFAEQPPSRTGPTPPLWSIARSCSPWESGRPDFWSLQDGCSGGLAHLVIAGRLGTDRNRRARNRA